MGMQICTRSRSNKLLRSNLSRPLRLSATPLAMLLFTVAVPSNPAAAIHNNDYELCASQLVRANVLPEIAADACAATIYPKDLTVCVYKINQQTNIAAADAVGTCRQVRRPRDLATCVININNHTQGAASEDILENCRRSLLPVSFSECVVGINRETNFSASQSMTTCIDGSDRPRAFYPPVPAPQNP